MILGSKVFLPLRYRIIPYFVLSHSSKTFVIRSLFFENDYLLMFFAGFLFLSYIDKHITKRNSITHAKVIAISF